jgi:putative transposase
LRTSSRKIRGCLTIRQTRFSEFRLVFDVKICYAIGKHTICVKYRLYPTHAQETALEQTLDICRQVYNSFLHWRKFAYETTGKAPTRYEQEKSLTVWKQVHPELKEVHAHLLQNVAVRVDLAFQAFFRRVKAAEKPGYPREKGAGCYDSLTFKQYGNGCRLNAFSLTLSKIGDVRAILHRELPGTPKTCTVLRHGDKWFASLSCEVENDPLPESAENVGIDVGIEKFAALSDGLLIENPCFFRKDEKALAKAQRRTERRPKGSHKRLRAKKAVRRIHERIANRRHDFCHQTARHLVNRFGLIAVEKLNVKGMVQNAGLAKSIADAAWSLFRRVLSEKAASAGRQMVEVNPAYTSQDCSGCGYRARKKLCERWHFCPMCGLSLDRDTNAAVNILKTAVGLHSVRKAERSRANILAAE